MHTVQGAPIKTSDLILLLLLCFSAGATLSAIEVAFAEKWSCSNGIKTRRFHMNTLYISMEINKF